MVRLGFIGMSVLMAFVPLTFYWAMSRPTASTVRTSPYARTHYYNSHSSYFYYGGGHGGWLSSSWNRGNGSFDRGGGASAFRGGGPGAGGK